MAAKIYFTVRELECENEASASALPGALGTVANTIHADHATDVRVAGNRQVGGSLTAQSKN